MRALFCADKGGIGLYNQSNGSTQYYIPHPVQKGKSFLARLAGAAHG
jgi:hypothetical protein